MRTKFLLVILAFISLSYVHAQVGIGTNTPDDSAILDIEATDKGLLPPRLSTSERDAISSPAEGLVIYNTDKKSLQWYDATRWYDVITGTYDPPIPTVIGANGLEWMDRNLGASQVATSSNDVASYGDLYQWGRDTDGHQLRSLDCATADCFDANQDSTSLPTTAADVKNAAWYGKFIFNITDSWHQDHPDDRLWQGVNGTNNPCPKGFRVPTSAELKAEYLSWSDNTTTGAFNSPLKLPAADDRKYANGNLGAGGVLGYYWSSTVSGNDVERLNFNNSNGGIGTGKRTNGFSVRCIKD